MSMVTEGKIRYLQHRRVVLIRFDVCACRKSSLRYFINTWTLIVQNAYYNTFESRNRHKYSQRSMTRRHFWLLLHDFGGQNVIFRVEGA